MTTYVCVQCGRVGVPDQVTVIDARYTTGKCPHHEGKQVLVAENVDPTLKPKKKRIR